MFFKTVKVYSKHKLVITASVVFPDDYNKSLALHDYRRVSPICLLLSLEHWFPLLLECHQGFNPVLGRNHLEKEVMKYYIGDKRRIHR